MVNVEKMEHFMLELGFPENLRGTEYLRAATAEYAKNPTMQLVSELYPALAKAYNSSPSKIERCMRHAIERAWEQGNPAVQQQLFGWTYSARMGRPRVGEYIARMARICREN